jgi:hypothetical protein
LGVQGHQPAVAASICLTAQATTRVTEAILRQKAGMTNRERIRIIKRLEIGEGAPINTRFAKLISVGPPRWRMGTHWPPERVILHVAAAMPVTYTSRILCCPHCDTKIQTAHLQLRELQGIRGVWCKQCKHQRRATSWKCSCGVGWQSCTVHAVDPPVHNPARVARTRRGNPPVNTRTLLPHDRPAPSDEGVQKRRR